MKYITALLVALVALVGVGFGQVAVDANVAASGNYAGQDNYNSLYVNVYSGGYGGYPYYYDYPYYNGYGGSSIYINQNVNQHNFGISQESTAVAVSGGADGADGADGQDGANGEPADEVPAGDTSTPETVAPVAPQVAVAPNGMQLVDGGQSLQNEVMDSPIPLEYVTYMDYNVLVVETRGVPTDVAQKFGVAAITNHGYKAVYFVQGLLVRADGSLENKTLDLTSPPRVARSLGYL